jgi:hypothetical protein
MMHSTINRPAAPRAQGAFMRKGLLLAVIITPLLLLLTACPPLASGVTGVTVSGTVSGYLDVIGQVTVTASRSGSDISTQVSLNDASPRSGPYSITNVPPGDYTFVIVFKTNYFYTSPAYYSIAGGDPVADNGHDGTDSGSPYTHTITFVGVPINETETIDLDLGNAG